MPTDVVATAVAGLLQELGCYQAPLKTDEAAGTGLTPADPTEAADSLTYAMRFDERGKARRTGHEYAARLAADHLLRHLSACGFLVVRKRR